MARFLRALSLTVALGAALATLVAVSPAAAGTNGGAAPTASYAGTGGATPGGPTGGPAQGSASSETTGGAKPGAKPPRRAVPVTPRRVVKTKPKPTRGSKGVRRQVRRTPSKAPRRATTPATTPTEPAARGTVAGRFPVVGAYTFGGEGSRFGAGRPGHIHQGQDVSAASGTPIVAPVAGTVTWKANQPGGAGIYLVVRGEADGRDYVFMHLKRGSVVVAVGQAVAAGAPLAQVGATGVASGPHLHFEIWVGGWQASGGEPVDPLPQLQRWAGGSS
jgi:murein DD-endopeptidase MepM/ murein hydrolase activator NlpD